MNNLEAAHRIREHNAIHMLKEPNAKHITEALEMAARTLEDIDSGKLVKLPCAIGDTVYDIWYTECHNGETHPDSYGCCGCEDECDMKRVVRPVLFQSLEQILSKWSSFKSGWYYMTEKDARDALDKEHQSLVL